VAVETVDIFKKRLTADEISDLCRKLRVSPREILRTKDPAYEQHRLGEGGKSDAEILALMAENPGLIQRPIVVKGKKAVVARPAEAAEALLK
jgi:arsenate reductase (glutaredoxin)